MQATAYAAPDPRRYAGHHNIFNYKVQAKMTVIINTIWGGRVTQTVDRQISRNRGGQNFEKVDSESNKVCIVLTRDALISIAYTGIAVAHESWIDCVIADCLAHRKLEFSMVQSGSRYLARPVHAIIKELSLNLNGKLNSDEKSRIYDLQLSVVGLHFSDKPKPLAWELKRGKKEENGNRYFKVTKHKVGKFLREHPSGLWGETLGNPGTTVDEGLRSLAKTAGFTHDDVERYLKDLIQKRSSETKSVSPECVSVQLDLRRSDGHAQFTFYPTKESPLLSPWVLTPRMICAPFLMSSSNLPMSDCGRYLLGGFEDGNTKLNVLTRIPFEYKQRQSGVISIKFQDRAKIP
jgi:hypothetical protein